MLDFCYCWWQWRPFCIWITWTLSDIIINRSIEFPIRQSMRVHTKILFVAWCIVKMNTFCNLPGSRQPSWIFVVSSSCPRMTHCHLTDLNSGTHNLYDSAKKPYTTNNFQVHKMATRVFGVTAETLDCAAMLYQRSDTMCVGRPREFM